MSPAGPDMPVSTAEPTLIRIELQDELRAAWRDWAITEKKSELEIEAAREALIPKAHKDLNRWNLDGYTKVARSFGLIEAETEKQADLAREFRNLIHPGRSTRFAKVCDRGTALSALAAVELIVRDLS